MLYWQAREIPLVERCVGDLVHQSDLSQIELRIMVVDNGCGGTPRLPAGASVDLVRVADNRGFAGGHNIGIRQAIASGADYVLLFNSDAVAEPGCVGALVAAAQAWPSAAFLGPLVLRAAARERIESAGQAFDTRTARHREIGRGQLAGAVGPCARAVDAISGCAMLARCAAIEAIGLLDEKLFAYFEDMDWCLRARRAGYQVVVVPRARVLHLGGGSTGGASPLSTYYSVRNHMLVAARYGGKNRGPLLKWLALAYQLAYLASSPEHRTRQHLRALAHGARAAWAGQLGAWRPDANWN